MNARQIIRIIEGLTDYGNFTINDVGEGTIYWTSSNMFSNQYYMVIERNKMMVTVQQVETIDGQDGKIPTRNIKEGSKPVKGKLSKDGTSISNKYGSLKIYMGEVK